MNRQIVRWALALAVSGLGVSSLMAQGDSGPLIDALVKKGVLSSQEGEEIRAEMLADYGSTPGGMLTYGSSAVKGLKLYGDARVRYQYENAQDQTNTGGGRNEDRNRYRYRLRLGADYTFTENWKAGVRLETAEASDSTNVDFGGYFDKTGDNVFVGLVYLQYETKNPELFGFSPADYFDLRMGKHLHPFLISNAWWDSDINPEGFSEQVGWTNVFTDGLNVTLRAGQYIVFDTNEQASVNANDGWLFVAQSEFKYSWSSKGSAAIAPTLFVESDGNNVSPEGAGNVDNENGINSIGQLAAILLPVEVRWTAFELDHRFFGTVGYNIHDEGFASEENRKGSDGLLWNAGYEIGKGKGKGSWKVGGEYRYVEADAWTPNLSDSDFAKNEQNQHGFVVTASYGFTDNITGALTYMKSWDIADQIDSVVSDNHTVDLLQVDLSWRF
jgi:hypothetical protein